MQKSAEVIVGIWTWKHGHANRRTESVGVLSMTEKGGMTVMAENIENNGCSQRDSAEHKGYA